MSGHRSGSRESGRFIDASPEAQRNHGPDAGSCHEKLTNLVSLSHLLHGFMQALILLPQDAAYLQKRFDRQSQMRRQLQEVKNALVELEAGHDAHLEAEVAQQPTKIVLGIHNLGLDKSASRQKHPDLLASDGFDMYGLVESLPHHLGDPSRIIAIGFIMAGFMAK